MPASERTELDRVAELLERLIVDPAFRAEFRAAPADACSHSSL